MRPTEKLKLRLFAGIFMFRTIVFDERHEAEIDPDRQEDDCDDACHPPNLPEFGELGQLAGGFRIGVGRGRRPRVKAATPDRAVRMAGSLRRRPNPERLLRR
jgi:hypothetical protein